MRWRQLSRRACSCLYLAAGVLANVNAQPSVGPDIVDEYRQAAQLLKFGFRPFLDNSLEGIMHPAGKWPTAGGANQQTQIRKQYWYTDGRLNPQAAEAGKYSEHTQTLQWERGRLVLDSTTTPVHEDVLITTVHRFQYIRKGAFLLVIQNTTRYDARPIWREPFIRKSEEHFYFRSTDELLVRKEKYNEQKKLIEQSQYEYRNADTFTAYTYKFTKNGDTSSRVKKYTFATNIRNKSVEAVYQTDIETLPVHPSPTQMFISKPTQESRTLSFYRSPSQITIVEGEKFSLEKTHVRPKMSMQKVVDFEKDTIKRITQHVNDRSIETSYERKAANQWFVLQTSKPSFPYSRELTNLVMQTTTGTDTGYVLQLLLQYRPNGYTIRNLNKIRYGGYDLDSLRITSQTITFPNNR